MIILTEVDSRLGMSPNITHGDLAPDRMSSTKLRRVSAARGKDKGIKDFVCNVSWIF